MKLSEINDIIRVIEKNRSDIFLPLDFSLLKKSSSNTAKFYRLITEGKITKDEEAAFSIFGEDHPGNRYVFLKSYFTTRLLNTIPFLEPSGEEEISEYLKATNKVYKDLFYSKILMRMGRRSGAISIAKKALAVARKFELHHPATELIELIRSESMLKARKKEYERYSKLLEEHTNLFASETKIKTLDGSIRTYFAQSLFTDQKYKNEAILALKKAKALLKNGETYLGRISFYRLLYICRQLEGYPERSIFACSQALEYMAAKPLLSPKSRFAEFHLYKLENYLILRDFENGIRESEICASYFKHGGNNWFRYKQYHFLLHMQKLSFAEAEQIHREVTTNPRFESQSEHIREIWKIFGMYLHYALHKKSQEKPGKIRIDTKDKKGFHVAIIMLRILELLEKKNERDLMKEVGKLSAFRYKYLLGKQSKESYLLLRLISVMVECKFDSKKMAAFIHPIERKLAKSSPGAAEILECIQVIPPVIMWSWMKETMSKPRGRF